MKDYCLVFKEVKTDSEAELLRQIRNECREYMTRSTDYITEEQQIEWFKNNKQKYDLFLVYCMMHGAIVVEAGYGVIHKNKDESLLTGGFVPAFRNQGLGVELFSFLINQSMVRNLPIRLEVLKTNLRALKTYKKLGFVSTGKEADNILFMEYKYDSVI